MNDITKANDEEIKKFLEGKVTVSGFSFENKVAKMLSPEFLINREEPYFDKDGEKGRTFDILARQFFPDDYQLEKGKRNSVARFDLVIECKDISGNIWVFSEDVSPEISLPLYASMNYGQKDPAMNVIPKEPVDDIQHVSAYTEYIFDEGKSNKEMTNLFSAITSITKAAIHQRESMHNAFEIMKKWMPLEMNNLLHFVFFSL